MLDNGYLLNTLQVHWLLIHHKYYKMLVKTYAIIYTIINMAVNFVELLNIHAN